MKSSVGRIVHYKADDEKCYAALVTALDTDTWFDQDTGVGTERDTAALNIHPPMCDMYQRVAFEGDTAGTWHWPEHVQ